MARKGAKTRITAKQKSARRRNMAVARASKKKKGPSKSTMKQRTFDLKQKRMRAKHDVRNMSAKARV